MAVRPNHSFRSARIPGYFRSGLESLSADGPITLPPAGREIRVKGRRQSFPPGLPQAALPIIGRCGMLKHGKIDASGTQPAVAQALIAGALSTLAFVRCLQDKNFFLFLSASAAIVLVAAAACQGCPDPETAPWPGLRRRPSILLVMLAAFLAVCYSTQTLQDFHKLSDVIANALSSPYPDDPMEGREAVKSWLLLHGTAIYGNLSDYQYLVTLYGPIFYLLLAAIHLAAKNVLLAGRCISLAAFALLALACSAYIWKSTRNFLASCGLMLLLLAFPMYGWEYAVKPDMLAWLFALTGLMLSQTMARPGGSSLRPALAGLLFALGIFTKMQTVAAPMAAFLYLGTWRAFGPMARLSAYTLGATAIFAAMAHILTGGMLLKQTVLFPAYFSALPDFNSYESAGLRFSAFLSDQKWLVAAGSAAVVISRLRRVDWFLEVCLCRFTLSSFYTLRWYGSSTNNFIGLLFVLYMLLVEFLHSLPSKSPAGCACFSATILLIMSLPVTLFTPTNVITAPTEPLQAIRALPLLTDKPILTSTENAYPFIGYTNPNRLHLFDAFELLFFDGYSGFDIMSSRIVKDIKNRMPDYILGEDSVGPAAVKHLTRIFYRPQSVWRNITVFEPRPGDIHIFNSLTDLESHGDSLLDNLTAADLSWKDGFACAATLSKPGILSFRLSGLPPGAEVAIRFFPGILGFNDSVKGQISDDGQNWRPWFQEDEIIGFNEQFWGDHAKTATTRPGSSRLYIRLLLAGTARLWMSDRSPMAVYATVPSG